MNIHPLNSRKSDFIQEFTSKRSFTQCARPIEMAIHHGLGSGQFIMFGSDEKLESLEFIIGEEENIVARASLTESHLLGIYQRYAPLNEAMHSYADQAGKTPDHEWFEKRAHRLGVRWSETWDTYLLPARSIAELVLSYSFSSGGIARFEKLLMEDNKYRVREVYKGMFIFAGKNGEDGWHEEYLILENRMQRFLAKFE